MHGIIVECGILMWPMPMSTWMAVWSQQHSLCGAMQPKGLVLRLGYVHDLNNIPFLPILPCFLNSSWIMYISKLTPSILISSLRKAWSLGSSHLRSTTHFQSGMGQMFLNIWRRWTGLVDLWLWMPSGRPTCNCGTLWGRWHLATGSSGSPGFGRLGRRWTAGRTSDLRRWSRSRNLRPGRGDLTGKGDQKL